MGLGIDFHPLKAGEDLILGGVRIEHDQGLAGFSDADVLTHSICDGLLGSVGLGDIGKHFPDTEERYRNICSLKLLEKVAGMATESGYRIVNIDSTVVAERPRLAPYRAKMVANIAKSLGIPESLVNIKATTSEGLGPWGREEGIAAYSIAAVEKV